MPLRGGVKPWRNKATKFGRNLPPCPRHCPRSCTSNACGDPQGHVHSMCARCAKTLPNPLVFAASAPSDRTLLPSNLQGGSGTEPELETGTVGTNSRKDSKARSTANQELPSDWRFCKCGLVIPRWLPTRFAQAVSEESGEQNKKGDFGDHKIPSPPFTKPPLYPAPTFFLKPKAEPEPPEPFSRNRNRNRNRPFLLNCAEIQKNPFLQRNRRNRKPEPLEPFHPRTEPGPPWIERITHYITEHILM